MSKKFVVVTLYGLSDASLRVSPIMGATHAKNRLYEECGWLKAFNLSGSVYVLPADEFINAILNFKPIKQKNVDFGFKFCVDSEMAEYVGFAELAKYPPEIDDQIFD